MPRPRYEPAPDRPAQASASGDRAALATLVAASMAGFFGALAGSSVNVALPAIGASLHASAVALSWVVTAFMLVSASLLLPLGNLADRIGRRRLFALGLAISAGSGMACAVARSASDLIALRAVMGVGGALQFATSMALVVALTPAAKRGGAIGIAIASVYVGLAAGPFIGGILTETFGWRSVFLAPAAGALPALALTVLGVPDDARTGKGQGFDLFGALVYVAGLSSVLFACSRLTARSGLGMGVLGTAALVGFVAIERRTARPLIDLRQVLHNRVFVLSNLAAMIHYAATSAVGYFLSLYLQSVRRLSPREAGLVLVIQPVFMAVLSPLAGRLSDRVQARWLASSGMLLSTVGLWLLAQVEASTSLAVVVAALVTLGVGFALFSSPNTNSVVSSVPHAELGLANAVLATMRNVGQALSMASALLLVSVYVGARSLGPLVAPGLIEAMRRAFGIFAVAALLGALASLARGSRAPASN